MEVKKRYTVLTYIFGNYEKVHEILEKDPEADYVLVTDNPGLRSSTWRVILSDQPQKRSPFGKCYTVRFHPFSYVDTPIVVRVDGSIQLRKSLKPFVDRFEKGDYDRCLMIHPHRNTMQKEYAVWVATRDYPSEQAERCLKAMQQTGYSLDCKGLYQGCFEIQRDNWVNNAINDLTFGCLCMLGEKGRIERLDQTVTSFVINRFYEGMLSVLPVPEDIITDGNFMQWYLHNSGRPIPLKKDTIEPYLFDKPCKPWKP